MLTSNKGEQAGVMVMCHPSAACAVIWGQLEGGIGRFVGADEVKEEQNGAWEGGG